MGTLYVVATPIGNLEDITLRALETLKGASLILAEDTRVTKKLLSAYAIQKPVWRFDENAVEKSYQEVSERLQRGETIAFVTDSGTPGIADPGWRLVQFLQSEFPAVKIVPIPGASAVAAALSVSGINADQFTFLGYPPHKKGRKTFFAKFATFEIRPIVLYESPHRFQKTLANLAEVLGADAQIIVGRELTKLFEEIFHGSITDATQHFVVKRSKGEFVVIIP